jgi:hypothetical protein
VAARADLSEARLHEAGRTPPRRMGATMRLPPLPKLDIRIPDEKRRPAPTMRVKFPPSPEKGMVDWIVKEARRNKEVRRWLFAPRRRGTSLPPARRATIARLPRRQRVTSGPRKARAPGRPGSEDPHPEPVAVPEPAK